MSIETAGDAGTELNSKTSLLRLCKSSLACLAVLTGAYVLLGTLRMVVICWDPLPFGDQWSEIVTGRPVTWTWLYAQHMEHRILLPRLVFLADRWLTGETNRIDYAVDFAIPAALALLVFRVSRGAGLRTPQARTWAAGVCLSLLLWAGQYQNFVWGFQVQFFGVVLASAAVFAVLALRPASLSTLALVVLLEFAAAYTLASGVLAGFLAVALAVLLRRPGWFVATLAAAALIVTASYLVGYQTPPESSDPLGAIHHAGGMAVYFLVALGAPVGNLVLLHAPFGVGFAACAVAGLLGVYVFARQGLAMARERGPVQAHQGMLMTLAGFVACMLLVTAAGRYGKGMESALVSRYATPAVTFWCCIVLVLAARAAKGCAPPVAVMAWVTPLVLLMGLSEGGNVALARNWVSVRRPAAPAFLADVADVGLFRKIYAVEPDGTLPGSAASRWGPALRGARSSVFRQDWAAWLGTKLAAHVARMDATVCHGTEGRTVQVQTVPAAGWRMVGSASDAHGRPVRRLVMMDARGVIVGYGVGNLDLAAAGLDDTEGADAWLGEFTAADPSSIAAVALLDDVGCTLPRPK